MAIRVQLPGEIMKSNTGRGKRKVIPTIILAVFVMVGLSIVCWLLLPLGWSAKLMLNTLCMAIGGLIATANLVTHMGMSLPSFCKAVIAASRGKNYHPWRRECDPNAQEK